MPASSSPSSSTTDTTTASTLALLTTTTTFKKRRNQPFILLTLSRDGVCVDYSLFSSLPRVCSRMAAALQQKTTTHTSPSLSPHCTPH